MIKIILFSLMFSNFTYADEPRNKYEFKADEAGAVDIRTGAADINLSAAEGGIKIETTGEYDEKFCDFSAKPENKILKIYLRDKKNGWKLDIFGFSFGVSAEEAGAEIKTEKKWFYFEKGGKPCKAGLKITAPKNKKLLVKNGAGNVKITGFSAGASIDTGAGDLEFKNFSGPVRIDSGAGSVKGDLYSEDLDLETGAGSVDLKWNSVPQKGKASFSSGAGSVVLSFPEASKMAIIHKSGAGSFDSEFGNDAKAEFRLEFKSGAGNLTISKF